MSRQVQILIPMGGLGQRFRNEGYATPKPLIEVNGTRMFLRALHSFDALDCKKTYHFVVRKDAEEEYRLASSIKEILPEAKVTILDHNTKGAAQTALIAQDMIDPDNPLIIMDCDFEFKSAQYFEFVRAILENKIYDGVLLSFSSNDPRYSYAKLDEEGFVSETAEKVVISNNALAGAYCFASGKLFITYANKLIAGGLSDIRKEYYISYVYSEMLNDDLKVKLAGIDIFHSFGTPAELKEYLAGHDD